MSKQSLNPDSAAQDVVELPCSEMPERYRDFAETVVENVGDDLRFLSYYTGDEFELYLIHDDMYEENLQHVISKLHRRALEGISLTGSEFDEEYGEHLISVSIHEEVVVMWFEKHGENEGIITSFDYEEGFLF